MKKILFAAASAIALAACTNEVNLSVSTESMVFTSEGGTQSFNVSADGHWTITGGSSWAVLSQNTGEGDATVSVTVGHYTGTGQNTTFYVASGSTIYNLNVVQERTPLPTVPETVSGTALNAAIVDSVFTVPAGYDYHVDVTVTAVDGTPSTTKAEDSDVVTVTIIDETSFSVSVKENDTGCDRVIDLAVLTSDNQLITSYSITQKWERADGDFIIDEIFFAGNTIEGTDDNDSGDGDQYVRITNASGEVLYADGIAFVMSETYSQLSSTGASWTYPDEPGSIGVSSMYLIPGNGTEHPVEPGESIVLAISAQNFKADNANGCDLSVADFEFYDENDYYPDTDNPDVPNLVNWFKSSFTITILHDRGYESLAIVRVPEGITSESFMADYAWEGKRVMDWNGYHVERDITDAYLIPNEWVLDAVNLAVDENLGTLAFNATVDAGYTNVSKVDRDEERFGKAVARKSHVDTNNSTNDFEIVTPSMK